MNLMQVTASTNIDDHDSDEDRDPDVESTKNHDVVAFDDTTPIEPVAVPTRTMMEDAGGEKRPFMR